jgi:hypothetical protein
LTALVKCDVGGRNYPLVASPRCRTCRSPQRREIEELVVGGSSFAEASRSYSAAGLSARNVREHIRRGHLPIEHEVVRRLVEQEVKEHIALVESGVSAKLAVIVLAQTTIRSVNERLMSGELEPTISEGIRMASLLASYDRAVWKEHRTEKQLRQSHEGFAVLFSIAKSMMSTEMWADFLNASHEDERLSTYVPPPASYPE